MNTYQLNSLVRVSGAFTASDGTPIDPTTVTVFVKFPDGSESSFTTATGVIRDGVGLYHYDLLVTVSGGYFYKWEGEGDVQVTSPDQFFQVSKSILIPG